MNYPLPYHNILSLLWLLAYYPSKLMRLYIDLILSPRIRTIIVDSVNSSNGWLLVFKYACLLANPYCRRLLRRILCLFSTHRSHLWFIVQLYWEDLSCSFWERSVLPWVRNSLNKVSALKTSVMMTSNFVLAQGFRLPIFTHMAWVKSWYGFQALYKGSARWDLLLQMDDIKKTPSWQVDHGEIRTQARRLTL